MALRLSNIEASDFGYLSPIKNAQSVNEFKNNIKSWNGAECTCNYVRRYTPAWIYMIQYFDGHSLATDRVSL